MSGRSWGWLPLGLVAVLALWAALTYNRLISLDQQVDASWGQVQNVYQRRADLVPNLVETVKGAAQFEKDTYTAVAEARARVGQTATVQAPRTPEDLARFEGAQQALSSAIGRLLVVAERYPDLKATANFRDLQAQLEGTENRIAVERMRFGEAALAYNTARQRFPALLIAGAFGDRFGARPYFGAEAGAQKAPAVKFSP